MTEQPTSSDQTIVDTFLYLNWVFFQRVYNISRFIFTYGISVIQRKFRKKITRDFN